MELKSFQQTPLKPLDGSKASLQSGKETHRARFNPQEKLPSISRFDGSNFSDQHDPRTASNTIKTNFVVTPAEPQTKDFFPKDLHLNISSFLNIQESIGYSEKLEQNTGTSLTGPAIFAIDRLSQSVLTKLEAFEQQLQDSENHPQTPKWCIAMSKIGFSRAVIRDAEGASKIFDKVDKQLKTIVDPGVRQSTAREIIYYRAKSGDVQGTKQLIHAVNDEKKRQQLYAEAVSALCESGYLDEANKLKEEITIPENRFSAELDCINKLDVNARIAKLLSLSNYVKACKQQPNFQVTAYIALSKAWGQTGDTPKSLMALNTARKLVDRQLVSSHYVNRFNFELGFEYAKHNELAKVKTRASKLKANTPLYTELLEHAVHCAINSNHKENTHELLKIHKKEGLNTDHINIALAEKLARSNENALVWEAIDQIESPIDAIITYNHASIIFERNGNLEGKEQALNLSRTKAMNNQIAPDNQTVVSDLVKFNAINSRFTQAEDNLSLLQPSRRRDKTFGIIISELAKNPFATAKQLLEKIKRLNSNKLDITEKSAVALAKNGNIPDACKLIESLDDPYESCLVLTEVIKFGNWTDREY